LKIGKVPAQVLQVGVVFLIVGATMIFVRQRFIPESFGDIGHYRADALDTIVAREIQYAGWQACAECHDDQVETKNSSYHRTVSCETCHGAASEHAREEADDDPVLPTGRELCLACHSYLASRPTGFPQIIEERHEPAKLCHTCHDPHDPVPSERPESCAGCHAAISRVKAVSHHEPLDCEVCHEAEPEHFLRPRSNLPRKPFERAFCGNCHARDADLPTHFRGVDLGEHNIPQIDQGTHGGTLLCWQCHYQHSPEVR
jgi:hypothetical protein